MARHSVLDEQQESGHRLESVPREQEDYAPRGLSPAASHRSVHHSQITPQNQTQQHITAMPGQYASAGRFAFAPATQQTTVVTTTTTTINLAPFVLQPAEPLRARDPKKYPLAYSPTPQAMRNLHFELGGTLATFDEPDSADDFVAKYNAQQKRLHEGHGAFRDVLDTQSIQHPRPLRRSAAASKRLTSDRGIAPPSLATAAEIARTQRRQGKSRSNLSQYQELGDNADADKAVERHEQIPDGTSPVTPETENDAARPAPQAGTENLASLTAARLRAGPTSNPATSRRSARINADASAPLPAANLSAATPPIMDSDVETDLVAPIPRTIRSGLPALVNTSSQLDASLPSPSLSPVTAAANLAQRQSLLAIRPPGVEDLVGPPEFESAPIPRRKTPPLFDANYSAVHPSRGPEYPYNAIRAGDGRPRSLLDVPEMISMFDALPTELQSYVMFQLLKRSSKDTLKSIAEVVNPALKYDPFAVLPHEISLKITKLLDARTMGRAAQVSKRWRHLVNTDEAAWRILFDKEGFQLADGELQRAICGGWGWQFATQHESEVDLSHLVKRGHHRLRRDSDANSSFNGGSDEDETPSASTTTTRAGRKRKAAGPSPASKRQKRSLKSATPGMSHDQSHDRVADEVRLDPRQAHEGLGPLACASAAALLLPDPQVGLPGLKSLHLFKSIFQRHWMVRKSWMDGTCEPHHLAFRAHHRHVVTCLLFDSDRIITGSDDTSINVFETKTGILRKRLEGHEGGVWALSCVGNTLVSGSTDRSVRIWNIDTGACLQTFQGHTSTVRCLVILQPTKIGDDVEGRPIVYPAEPTIITGSRDSTLRVWRLPGAEDPQLHQAGPPDPDAEGNPYSLRTLSGHHNSVRAIAAFGDTLVSGSYDCTVRVWRISTGEMVHRLAGHAQKVYSVVLDYWRGRCISGSMDNLVKVWSTENGTCLFNLEGHTSLVGLLELNNNALVSAAADSTLRVWDPENGACRSILSAHTGAITCFQHDGQKVISGSDRTLKMWNIETGACIRDLLTNLSGVWQVRFDERRCVAAVQRNNLTYIEVLDFGASRDGIAATERGRRIVVDTSGNEIDDDELLDAMGNPVAEAAGAEIVNA